MDNRILNPYRCEEGRLAMTDREVVEIPLLLPGWQVAALTTAAQDRGLTAGEMMRHVLRDFIDTLEERPTFTGH